MASTAGIIEILETTGHLRRPNGVEQQVPAVGAPDYPTALDDPLVVEAIKSYQVYHVGVLQPLVAAHHPERASATVHVDGAVGPAMEELFDTARCECEDYLHPDKEPEVQAAVGEGSWKRCHGIGNWHAAIVQVDEANMPPHWRQPYKSTTVFLEVLRRVQGMYDGVGLRFYFVNSQGIDYLTGEKVEGSVQTKLSFVTSSSGWIGLAIVPQTPQSCSSNPIWLRLLASFGRNFDIERLIRDLTSLLAHELGHNCSLGHQGGGQGVMSPYIVPNLPGTFIGDPSQALLVRRFGGVAIPKEPDPEPPPPPTGSGYWPDLLITDEATGKKYRAFPQAEV